MTPKKKYTPKEIFEDILKSLEETSPDTPTGISKKTGYDRRAISKYLDLLDSLGKTQCKEVDFGKRKVKICSIVKEDED